MQLTLEEIVPPPLTGPARYGGTHEERTQMLRRIFAREANQHPVVPVAIDHTPAFDTHPIIQLEALTQLDDTPVVWA